MTNENMRSAEQRIIHGSDGIYYILPRKKDSKAILRGPFEATDSKTGERFVYRAPQQKGKDGTWRDPVLSMHPKKLQELWLRREQYANGLPDEVRAELGL